MERRRVIQLLAGAATSLCVTYAFPGSLVRASQAPLMPLFPLDLVLFPHTDLPLHIFEERYKEMIQDCLQNRWEFGMLSVQDQSVNDIGCTASISEVLERYPDGRMDIMVRGQRRFELASVNEEKSYLRGDPTFLDDDASESSDELRRRAIELYDRLKEIAVRDNKSLQQPYPTASDTQLSYRMMAGLPADLTWKQNLLELRSERERLIQVVPYLEKFIEYLETAPDQQPGLPRGIA